MRTWWRQSTFRLTFGLFCPEDAWQGMVKQTRNRSLRCPQSQSTGWVWRHRRFATHCKGHEGRSAGGKVVLKKRSFIQSITVDSRWWLSRLFCFCWCSCLPYSHSRSTDVGLDTLSVFACFVCTAVYSSLDAYCAHTFLSLYFLLSQSPCKPTIHNLLFLTHYYSSSRLSS